MKRNTLQIRLEPELTELINQAVRRSGLTKRDVVRQGLRKGVPEIVRTLAGPPKGRTLVNALLELKGLKIPNWRR
jgi:hypothetical protein